VDGDRTSAWKVWYRIEGAGDGEKRWRLGENSAAGSVLIGLSNEGTARPLWLEIWSPSLSGDCPRRFERGTHLVARECHFSFGSPSRKLLSAQRGCGLPVTYGRQQERSSGKVMAVPRSSRTRLSSSAILFLRRVFSSTEGSSLSSAV
jgi:hypothetical protein